MAIGKKEEPKIRQAYKPSQKQKDELEHVYDRKYRMEDARQEYATDWDTWRKQYESLREEKKAGSWQANYVVPITTSVVESILSEMVDQSPRPLILPREKEDQPVSTVLKHVFNYTWETGDGDMELYKVLKDSLILGTGIAQEYYLSIPRKVQILVSKDPKTGEEKYEETNIKEYDNCYMEAVKLEDFFVDETARGFRGPRGARDCIRRYIMYIDDFRSQFKGPVWDQFGDAKYVKSGGDTNYYEWYKPPQGFGEDQVEVLWYWNKPEDKLMVVANDVLVRSTPNPYNHKQLPFARCVDIMNPHHFYGKGEPEIMESLQEELNVIRRQRIDRAHLSIDQMFMVSGREMLDDNQLIARPHGKIEVDDINNIKPLEYKDTPRSGYEEEDRLKEDAVRVTGYDDRMQSVQKPGTATEAAILKESSLKRVRLKLRILEKEFLTNVGRLRISNIQQFYSVPKIKKIVGKKGAADYDLALAKAKTEGRYLKIENEDYMTTYRKIRIPGKKLELKQDNSVAEIPIKGYSFFEVRPELLAAQGEFDIQIESGSTLPISKPLMQSKTQELYDRLMPLALNKIGYDPIKIADALLEVNDYNPDDFKLDELLRAEEQKPRGGAEDQVQMAGIEIEGMMRGEPIGPTPGATPEHTEIIVSFMKSQNFKEKANDEMVKIFTKHVTGEMLAQKQRMAQEGEMGQAPGPQGGPRLGSGGPTAPANQMGDVMPGLAQGGENTQPVAFPQGEGPNG